MKRLLLLLSLLVVTPALADEDCVPMASLAPQFAAIGASAPVKLAGPEFVAYAAALQDVTGHAPPPEVDTFFAAEVPGFGLVILVAAYGDCVVAIAKISIGTHRAILERIKA